MESCVYGLIDPRSGELRYIGKTQNLARRLRQHLQTSELRANTYKVHWLRELLTEGLRPTVMILEEAHEGANLNDSEKELIEYFRSLGYYRRRIRRSQILNLANQT